MSHQHDYVVYDDVLPAAATDHVQIRSNGGRPSWSTCDAGPLQRPLRVIQTNSYSAEPLKWRAAKCAKPALRRTESCSRSWPRA
jgi:hypothetical protein